MEYEADQIIKLVLCIIILNTLFIFLNKNFTKFLNLYDKPDKKRKLHNGNPSQIGGVYLFSNLLVLFVFNEINIFSKIQMSNFSSLFFFISIVFIFLIGFFDDKNDLNPNLKLVFLCLSIFIFILTNDNFLLKEIKFISFEKIINLNNYSYLITILCILLFMNAFNMMDGTNSLAGLYSVIFLIYVTFFIYFNILNIVLITFLFFYLYLNNKNLIFLGDSGSLLLSFLLSIIVIYNHNLGKIFSEEIFFLMMIPGIDMFRLFLTRILNKKNPFSGDRNHLHHLLLNKYNNRTTVFIYNGFFITNLILYNIIHHKIILISCTIIFYLALINYLLSFKKNLN